MKITLTGNPMSTQHIYLQKGWLRFMTAEAKARKQQYSWEAKIQYGSKKPLEGKLEVEIHLYFGDKRRHDWDNFHKLLDSLNGIVWVDDSQIQIAKVYMDYDKTAPRIELYIDEFV